MKLMIQRKITEVYTEEAIREELLKLEQDMFPVVKEAFRWHPNNVRGYGCCTISLSTLDLGGYTSPSYLDSSKDAWDGNIFIFKMNKDWRIQDNLICGECSLNNKEIVRYCDHLDEDDALKPLALDCHLDWDVINAQLTHYYSDRHEVKAADIDRQIKFEQFITDYQRLNGGLVRVVKGERNPNATWKKFFPKKSGTPTEYQVAIDHNKSIAIVKDGICSAKEFKLGDTVEYDSYNLSYHGTIVGISDKTVSVQYDHDSFRKKITRMKLSHFCWRNYGFNEAEENRKNAEMMYTL